MQKVNDVHLANNQLFDAFTFHHMFTNVNSGLDVQITQPDKNPPLLSKEFNTINKVMLAYHYLYGTTEINDEAASECERRAQKLIDLICSDYEIR